MTHGSKYYDKHFIEEGPEFEIKVSCNNKECGGFFAFDIRLADNDKFDQSDPRGVYKVYCPYCGLINRYVI